MNAFVVEALISIVIAFAVGGGGYYAGHRNGENAQKAIDQAQFDAINDERSKQKQEASALLDKLQAGIIAQMDDDAKLRKKLDDQAKLLDRANDDLATVLAPRKLQFVAPARKGSTDRSCRAGAPSSSASAAEPVAPALIQLPEPIARNLRLLTKDADDLNVEYGKCFAWVNRKVNDAP